MERGGESVLPAEREIRVRLGRDFGGRKVLDTVSSDSGLPSLVYTSACGNNEASE